MTMATLHHIVNDGFSNRKRVSFYSNFYAALHGILSIEDLSQYIVKMRYKCTYMYISQRFVEHMFILPVENSLFGEAIGNSSSFLWSSVIQVTASRLLIKLTDPEMAMSTIRKQFANWKMGHRNS